MNQRPVSQLTFALNYAAGGENVTGYHVVNLLLHILTAFLVFLLSRISIGLIASDDRLDKRFKDVSSVFIAMLFLLHPVQTMAVTYIVQRMTILAALFYILAVYFYAMGRLHYLNSGKLNRSIILIALAFVTGIAGVLSKQNAATFPAAFLLYELFFIRKPDGRICKKYILAGLSIIVLAFAVVVLTGSLPAENPSISRIEYLSAQFGVFHKYILLILFPISQNADYFIRLDPHLFGGVQYLGIALITGLATLGIYIFNKNRLVSFGIFWFMLCMSVESSIIPIRDIMMEHRLYLPMFGIGMILAGLIMRYVKYKAMTTTYVAGGLVLILLMIGTYQRNKTWKTDISLWEDCLEKNPENPRAMNNLGYAIKVNANNAGSVQERTRDLNLAINYFTRSMQGDTVFVQAHMNRGLAWFELGEYGKALRDIDIVVEKRPDDEYLKHYIEGVLLAKQGELEAAAEKLEVAAGMNKDFAPLYTWHGLVFAELTQYKKALKSYLYSLKLNPSQTILYINISNMYFYLNQYPRALKWIIKAKDVGEQVDHEYIRKLEQFVARQKGPA